MAVEARRIIGNLILFATAILLVLLIAGMVGWIPKLPGHRELAMFAFVLAIVAGRLRRDGARRTPSVPPVPPAA